jgi:hypothetical protein
MRSMVIAFVCVMLAPLAFAKTRSNHHIKRDPATVQRVTVTGTPLTEQATVADFVDHAPIGTLVVCTDGQNPAEYDVLKGPGHVLNERGQVVDEATVPPGAHMRVVYGNQNGRRVVNYLVEED